MLLNLLWYFIFFSFCGWLMNGIRTLFTEKRFYNRGFLTSPFCPSYGFCCVICYLIMHNFTSNKLILFVGCTLVLSLLVGFIGLFTEKLLGFKPWDFSGSKFKIGNFITVPYALFLGVAGFVAVVLIIPLLDILIAMIPESVSIALIICLCVVIIADYVFSIITVVKLMKKIKNINDLSILLPDDVSAEKVKELESNYNKLFTENYIRRHLASSFPDLRNTVYIEELAQKIERVKQDNMKEYSTVYDKKEEKPFAFGFCFTKLFYLFVIGSVLGTVVETFWAVLMTGHFEVRVGMVYGPFIPVYGGGACFLTVVLYKLYKLSDKLIFVISAVVGASFEYFCSWLQETLFGTVSWDYSNTTLNINGRTNLMYALIWGFLGLVWVRYLYPFAAKQIEKIPKKTGALVTTFLIIFMLFNAFMSCSAVYRWDKRVNDIPAANTFEMYLDNHFDDDRMEFLFPNMVFTEK